MPLPLLSTLAGAWLTLASHVPAALPHPAPALPQSEAEVARLLPTDAVFVLRLESPDAFAAFVGRLQADGEGAPTAGELLSAFDLPGDTDQVDTSRPVYMAVATRPGNPAPSMTFVVSARDTQAYLGSLEGEVGWKAAVAEGHVGVSQAPDYAAATEPSPLIGRLRPGLASLHLDLATLIRTFRPFIEMGLSQAESQIDMLSEMSAGPMDIGPLLEFYLELAWDFVDSAEALDMALVQQGNAVQLSGWLATLEKSPMAGWGEGPAIDLRGWPAAVQADATLSMAMAGDWALMMKRMQPLLDASFTVYPDETEAFLRDYMAACEPLFGLMGPAYMGGDLGDQGMRMGYVVRSSKPEELLDGLRAVAQRFSGGEKAMGIGITAPETIELGGVQALRFRMDIDYEAMAASMGEELRPADREKMQQAMAALYGEGGLTFTMAPTADGILAAFGGGDDFARRILTAPAGAAGKVPADIQHALAAASGGSMGLVYRFDLGKLMEEIGALATAFGGGGPDLGDLPTGPLSITTWFGIRERTWSGGLGLDLDELSAFIRAAAEAEGAGEPEAEEPYVFEVFGEPDTRGAIVEAEMALVEAALELFAINNGGHYPDTLEILVVPDENGERYLDELPTDPWGNAYVYELTDAEGYSWRLTCRGSDGEPGGEGEAADVVLSGGGR